jgi:hypothetical protein
MTATLDAVKAQEFEEIVEQFIAQLAEWDGALPIDTFLSAWAEIDTQRRVPEIQAQVVGDHLILAAPPDSPVMVEGDRIRWEDGHEVVVRLAA